MGRSDYNALQLELRRRLSGGLQFHSSYTFGKQKVHSWQTHRRGVFMVDDSGNPGHLDHVFKLNAVYVVRVVGMSMDEVRDMFDLRFDHADKKIWNRRT